MHQMDIFTQPWHRSPRMLASSIMAAAMPTVAHSTVRHSRLSVGISTLVPMLNSRKYWPRLATPAKPEISMTLSG